jgi:geranylgeranyl pyrophosphate synthase
MLRVAADAHRRLCAGQGRELLWRRRRRVLTPAEVVDIFRLKTSPAFEVALRIGAIAAGAGSELVEALRRYSEAIGIAYQLRDDVEDLWGDVARPAGQTPSLVLALAWRRAEGDDRELLEAVWTGRTAPADPDSPTGRRLAAALRRGELDLLAGKLLERYKTRAIRCLQPIANAELKGLLRRVVGRIFADAAGMSCCREYQAGHDAGRSGGAGSAA